jgi:DNA polymerase family A/Bifunctional DNA primase/polymerase, N-terminal/Family of unknown function (DUF5906)
VSATGATGGGTGTGVFASAHADYASAGWTCIIPVPPEAKFPPPEGFTGAAGVDTDARQLAAWASSRGGDSIALRLPDGVIGIDVDHYDKGGVAKRGADTLALLEDEWGTLPSTWSSTARGTDEGPGPARIMFFRVPPGRYTTRLGEAIDIIQHHHRYAVVAPSPHAGAGAAYRWYDPDGRPTQFIPVPQQLPALPPRWVAGLAEGATAQGPAAASRDAGQLLLDILLADVMMPCAEMDSAGKDALAELAQVTAGSRHDAATRHVYHVMMLGAEGHPGCGWVLQQWIGARWDELTAGEGRDGEFGNMLLSAARKAATTRNGLGRAGRDPCITARALGWDAPAPADPGLLPADMLQAPRQWSPREAWGAHLFDTKANLDGTLARDVLGRTLPGLRYAADAGTWLVRGPLMWGPRKGDLAAWAVDEMFWLMPKGDASAPDGSELSDQAKRRARFGTNASANAIAGKMASQVRSGGHPCALEMTDLDASPDILWAGGVAWDLRASADYPVIATSVDPGTPHLHSAACVPENRPTPLFDAFLRAVWPDPEMREWALRVLSVAFTGHPDKSLPILLGPTDAGKTSIIQLLMSVLGSYALKSADARLLSAADRSHASIVYALKGCRLAFIDEAPRTGHLAQERLKSLTGGAPLTGNRMGENPITFAPTHTLILTANPDSEPVLTDPAVRRRVRLLACEGDPEQVRAARAAIGFLSHAAWRAEAPGVLALMMSHAARWLADPRTAENAAAPEGIRMAAERIAASQDVIGTWVSEEAEPSAAGTKARELYKNFVASCRDRGIAPQAVPTETKWGRRLTEMGYPSDHRRDGWYRLLRVRPPGSYFAEPVTPPQAGPPVTGSPGDVTGSVTGSEQTRHTQNPSSDTVFTPLVTGVTGKHAHITHTSAHTRTHAHAHMQGPTQKPVTPVNPSLSAGQELFDREKPITATRHNPSQEQFSQVSEGVAESASDSHPVTRPAVPADEAVTGVTGSVLAFDLEGGNADELFTYQPHDDIGYVRLAGAIGPSGDPVITDARTLIALLEHAGEISGHNVLGYDLLALAYHHGADYDRLAAKAADTELIARQADPPRSRESGTSLDRYGLDAVAQRLGVAGKTDELARLKRKYGGYDRIPTDDPEYRSYLEGDLRSSAAVLAAMRARYPADPYVAREHRLAALAGRMTLNGFRVDTGLLSERLRAGEERKQQALRLLHDGWGLPLTRTVLRGRGQARAEHTEPVTSPLATDAGRAWLAAQYERYQVPDPPRTAKKGKLALGAEDLKPLLADPRCPGELRSMLALMAIVTTTRTVYQTASDCLSPEGRVHPFNSFRQASGRWSVTNPGLTVFGKRGGRHVERDIFLPDEGHVLLSFDLSQVDMRAMAWLSRDHAYRALFARGRDAHAEIAAQVGIARQDAKAIGHGWNYGLGRDRMIRDGLDPGAVDAFISGMTTRFPDLVSWREQIRDRGKAGDILDNGFGRRMRCDPSRAYTVAPALMGQGGARDIMGECLLRLPRELWPMLRVMVHDEVILSSPKDCAIDVAQEVNKAFTWNLDDDLPVLCDMAAGMSWGEASAK